MLCPNIISKVGGGPQIYRGGANGAIGRSARGGSLWLTQHGEDVSSLCYISWRHEVDDSDEVIINIITVFYRSYLMLFDTRFTFSSLFTYFYSGFYFAYKPLPLRF